MGSISTVSSQTFKTYCFMSEKKGWRDGKVKEKKTVRLAGFRSHDGEGFGPMY